MTTPSDQSYRLIPLTRGYFATVDEEDFERASMLSWNPMRATRKDGSTARIIAVHSLNPGTLYLHRFILEITDPMIHVDHRNHDSLDCRRENLRTCTRSQNAANQRRRITNKSGFKGVYPKGKKWVAQLADDYLGTFFDPEEAARRYDVAASARFGEYAHLNFPLTYTNLR